MFDSDARERAYELVAADASDHVVRAQASSQGVGHRDEQGIPGSMASGVVCDLQPIHVDVSSYELSAVALGAIDLAPDGSQSGAAAAYTGQLVGPGIFTVLGGLRAIFRCNLAVVAGSYAAVRGISALRGSPDTCVLRALTIARGAIPGSAVAIPGRVVTRFGLSVAQPGGDVSVPRGEPGLSATHSRQLVGPGILAVLRRMRAIFGCNLAVIDSPYTAVGRLSAPRVGPRTLVCGTLTVARRPIPRTSVAITSSVVSRLGLLVTQPRRDVAVPCGEPGLPTAHGRQLVGPGILAVPRRLGAIVCGNFAVVDGSFAAIGGISTPRVGPRAFICGTPAIARRAIRRGSVELTSRVVTRLGVSVTLLGGEVTRPRSQPRNFAILRGLGAIFGRQPAVVDGLGAVIRSLGAPRGGLSALVCRAPAIPRCAVPSGSVKVTRRVVTPFGLSVTQPGRDITVLSSQPRHPAARACQLVGPGIVAVLGRLGTVFGRHPAVVDRLGPVVSSPSAPRGGLVTFVCGVLTVGRRAIPGGSVEITRRVITCFRLSVAQPRRDVTVLRSQAGLPTAHSCQLVGPGILAVLGCFGAVFGRHLAVVDRLGPVIRSLSAARGRSGTFACRLLTITRRAISRGSVEVTRGITRLGLSIALLRLSVTHVRGQIAVAPFDVTLACLCQGVLAFIRSTGVLIWECRAARPSLGHVRRP